VVDAVSLDSTVPLAWAREHLQARHAVQGNLDPVLLLTGGPSMDTTARAIVAALRGGPFVFNLGHGILPETPPETVTRLVEAVRGGTASR
jgi:uroporphyrinogen decarboxylase